LPRIYIIVLLATLLWALCLFVFFLPT